MQQKLKEKEEVYNKLKSLAMKSKKEAGQLKSKVSQLPVYTLSMCKIQGKSSSTISRCQNLYTSAPGIKG